MKVTKYKVVARPRNNLRHVVTEYLKDADQKKRWVALLKQNDWVVLEA